MKATASGKIFFLILFLGLLCSGCNCFSPEKKSLEQLQKAVRSRMLKLQVTEFLAETARERFQSEKSALVFSFKTGYQEEQTTVENDLALQILEEAIRYGLTALSARPRETAEKLIARRLDFMTLCALVNLQKKKNSSDQISSLAMLSGWESEKVKGFAAAPLPDAEFAFFAIDRSSERLLDEQGNKAAFDLAADIYRNVEESKLRQAERLHRAMINRYLMQIKSSGPQGNPELLIALQRGKLFDSFFSAL